MREDFELSRNLKYYEAVRSNTASRYGIDNHPNQWQLAIMRNLALNIFQPIRDHFGKPIYVSSFYRSPSLNKRIGGASRSDHMVMEYTAAIDLDNDGMYNGVSNADIFWYVYENLPFKKLIWEFGDAESPGWVHISFSIIDKENEERNAMFAYRENGRVKYDTFKPTSFR